MATGSVKKVISERTGRVSWRARVSFTDANGERHHVGKTFATKGEATSWRTRQLNDLRTGDYFEASADSVDDLFQTWISRSAHRLSASSLYRSQRLWEQYCVKPLSGKRAATIRQADIQAIYDDLLERGYSPNTIIGLHRVLRQMFAMAVVDKRIKSNPAQGCALPKTRRRPPVVWSPEQAQRFIAFVEDKPTGPVWILLLTTGMRIGEAFALTWEDVDLVEKQIRIEWTLAQDRAGGLVRKHGAKTKTSNRTIPLSEAAINALTIQRHTNQRQRELAGPTWHTTLDLVFPNLRGEIQWPRNPTIWFDRYRTALDLPYLTPHGLRHTAASLLLTSGVPAKVIQEQLGHASITMTLDLYAHLDEGMRRSAASQMDTVLATQVRATTSDKKPVPKNLPRQNRVKVNPVKRRKTLKSPSYQ